MQQKLSICCALLHKPRVAVFDEPMVGLDPHAIKELKELFGEMRADGASVLISTHMLDSVEGIWDAAYIMMNGRIAARSGAARATSRRWRRCFSRLRKGGRTHERAGISAGSPAEKPSARAGQIPRAAHRHAAAGSGADSGVVAGNLPGDEPAETLRDARELYALALALFLAMFVLGAITA